MQTTQRPMREIRGNPILSLKPIDPLSSLKTVQHFVVHNEAGHVKGTIVYIEGVNEQAMHYVKRLEENGWKRIYHRNKCHLFKVGTEPTIDELMNGDLL